MRRYLIFVSGGLGFLMYSIDSTAVVIAFPNFIKDFGTNGVTCLLDLVIWPDLEPSDLTRTNVNLHVPGEVVMVFDKP